MRSTRLAFVLTTAAASLLLLASPALAHVTVQGQDATQGGYTKVTFRVPTERDVNTTKVEILFPVDAPLADARVKPHAGWTFAVKKVKPAAPIKDDDGNSIDQVVSSITWTATAGGISPSEFDEFEVSAGPLPEKDQMVFKALQTYSDGVIVRWIEGEDGEHPAPVLKLAAATTDQPSATPTATTAPAVITKAETMEQSDSTSYVAVGLGGAALLLAAFSLLRGRKVS
ncbi:MAG: hypothetical protein JWM40_1854 [Frankiales bacterium]|nr:hypothetical protein [Frankiales bacterium]